MSFDSASPSHGGGVFPKRALTIGDESHNQLVTVYIDSFDSSKKIHIDFHKKSTTEELIEQIITSSQFEDKSRKKDEFEIYETLGTLDGRTFKERKLDLTEYPVGVQDLWSRSTDDDSSVPRNRFVLRKKGEEDKSIKTKQQSSSTIDNFLVKFLQQPVDREYADLCNLPELTEQTLLDNLKDRFKSGHIYTYIGPILVAVNPFCFTPLYNPKYARLYCQTRRLGALPPHIFAIADVTYHNMLKIRQNQVVVISGESGSGKTESTNFLLHHLTTFSQKGGDIFSIERMLLAAGPVLEAFGNALTLQNNNSSRFGKFIKVNYRENGMISGANVEIYLLEKSRIISQAKNERNYHVFYYVLEGASEEEKKKHFLLDISDYKYLNKNEHIKLHLQDCNALQRLKHSMTSVGFLEQSQQKMFGIISAVLLLGNISFVKRPGYHSDENAFVEDETLIDIVANLLDIKANQLIQALTMRKTVLKHDTVVSRYHVAEAGNTRDAMAKCLYNALFHWIVLKMNQNLIGKDVSHYKRGFYIGILDIFGFEDVGGQWNSFEQLCINYANEHLQAYFNQHIFQFEQEEYIKENINWTNIEYTDNTECVQLFQSKPYGLLRLIDEECNINNATDITMLEKLNTFLKNNEYYEIPHKKEEAFIIAHYAGKVKYQIVGFREKNKDLMRQDVMNLLKSTKSVFVRETIADDPVAFFRWKLLKNVVNAAFAFRENATKLKRMEKKAGSESNLALLDSQSQPSRRGSDTHLNAFLRGEISEATVPEFCDTSCFKTIINRANKNQKKPKEQKVKTVEIIKAVKDMISKKPFTKKSSSVSRQFEFSLSNLMKTLAQSTPYFIRCIKSNNEKHPKHFDDNIILRQLRYTGMLETVRIRRAGYSVRLEYWTFIQQYRILLPKGRHSNRHDIKQFFEEHPLIEHGSIQFGISKVFMRDAEKLLLDDHLHRTIMQHVNTLQCWFRSVLQFKRYQRLKLGVTKLQALVRGIRVRNDVRKQQYAATVIQAFWKRFKTERRYKDLQLLALTIQAWFRSKKAIERTEEIKKHPHRHVTKFALGMDRRQRIDLPSFNLGDPATFAQFALPSDDESDTDQLSGEDNDNWESSEIDLDATFILEDTKLKLIGESDKNRRQSLATTGSTAKLKMLRRAASTESDQIPRIDLKVQSPTSKLKFSKIGFGKAKKHIKALLTKKGDEMTEDENDTQTSTLTLADKSEPKLKHNFKMSVMSKTSNVCSYCNKNISSMLIHGYKCTVCKTSFHKSCTSYAHTIPCIPSSPRPDSKKSFDFTKSSLSPSSAFSLTKTWLQTDSTKQLIATVEDLHQFNSFIFKKQCQLELEKKKDTLVDAVFKKTLREFHMELLAYQAVFTEDNKILKYSDLISTFEELLVKISQDHQFKFPTTLGTNAFRGFLNEFMQQQKRRGSNKRTNIIRTVRKRRRRSDVTVINGHRFKPDFVNVPTYCEVCNQFMYHAEKVFVCVHCRLSCHKKCHTKINDHCTKAGTVNLGKCSFFGADLGVLVGDELVPPTIVNNMFMAIEVKYLFVEGIYRKSGSLAAVRAVRREIDNTQELSSVDFGEISVHVITTIVKAFFRELREPLITFELYENFIHVSEVQEHNERLKCLSVVIDLLPKHNKVILDRLMYHLARVAHQQSVNKMSASNLAVIFAPCILRRNQPVHAQEQLEDVQKQAICVQMLIEEKLRQYKDHLHQIVALEHASEKVSENLRKIEQHRRHSDDKPDADSVENLPKKSTSQPNMETARQLFEEQLEFLDNEKVKLIQELPPLAPVASIEDLTSSDEQRNHSPSPSLWSNGDLLVEEYAIDMEAPPVLSQLPSLYRKYPRPQSLKRIKKRS